MVWCGVFLLDDLFLVVIRIMWAIELFGVLGGYILIKRIKWELIRIKGS